nr:uncharacterized protein LOC120966125 [Aegilops tauschii subsp. strangulata]
MAVASDLLNSVKPSSLPPPFHHQRSTLSPAHLPFSQFVGGSTMASTPTPAEPPSAVAHTTAVSELPGDRATLERVGLVALSTWVGRASPETAGSSGYRRRAPPLPRLRAGNGGRRRPQARLAPPSARSTRQPHEELTPGADVDKWPRISRNTLSPKRKRIFPLLQLKGPGCEYYFYRKVPDVPTLISPQP